MEAAAVDNLVAKANFPSAIAIAVAEAFDITLKAANFVTLPQLDVRLAALEAKMEARFGQIEARFGQIEARFGQIEARFAQMEASIASLKAWVTYLYAGLVIAMFSALAMDHHWLVSREDQLVAQMQGRLDATLARLEAIQTGASTRGHSR